MKSERQIILAIESAIAGGSLSLLSDGKEIANWTGRASVSKAEDLLPNIDAMLSSQGLNSGEIGLIAVSAGPGSFTGIRIGIATALGLRSGLDVKMMVIPVLKALAHRVRSLYKNVTVAVPTGRNAVCVQAFSSNDESIVPIDDATNLSETELIARVHVESHHHFLVHPSLYALLQPAQNISDSGADLARAIGGFVFHSPNEPDIEPLFISKDF